MDEKNVIERIKKYIQWPLWFGAYWLAMAIIFRFAIGRGAALLCVLGGAAYMALSAFLYNREKTRCASGLIRLAAEYGQIQNKLLKEFILPYALLDMKGGILWMNDEFAAKGGVICISEVIDISPSNLDTPCASSSPAFLMMYYAYKLNNQGYNIQP